MRPRKYLRTIKSCLLFPLLLLQLLRRGLGIVYVIFMNQELTKDLNQLRKLFTNSCVEIKSCSVLFFCILMKNNNPMQDPEFKKLVSGTMSLPACVATAGTTLIIGYGLGWRGETWYANRKFRKEQMKLLGLIKPKRWPIRFLRRPFVRFKMPENAAEISESSPPDASVSTRNQS